mgnify:CR=1 FL=1
MGPEIYHIFIVCGIIAKEWRKEMSNASKIRRNRINELGIVIYSPFSCILLQNVEGR